MEDEVTAQVQRFVRSAAFCPAQSHWDWQLESGAFLGEAYDQ